MTFTFRRRPALRALAFAAVLLSPVRGDAGAPATSEVQTSVGVQSLTISPGAGRRELKGFVWYPAAPGGASVSLGEDRIFEGTAALEGALAAGGDHPLVLLSHGSGASVQKMAWIASRLVLSGYVVAGVNHPGTTTGDSTPEDTPKLWQRTADLSALLDLMLEEPDWAPLVDPERIGVLGFSLGGAAVLRIAGARARVEDLARYCENHPEMDDCRWYAGGTGYRDGERIDVPPFDLRSIDREAFEREENDARIAAVVAVDPALAAVFDPASLEAVDTPLTFINLGAAGTVPVGVRSEALAAAAPSGRLENVPGAVHFSFLPVCRPGAVAFLERIGESDRLCDDAGDLESDRESDRERSALHEDIAQRVLEAFRRAFGDVR